MKKTLLICGHYPSPETIGTNMRTINFARFFRQFGTVDIAYFDLLPGEKVESPYFSNEYRIKRKYFRNTFERYFIRLMKRIPEPIYEFSDDS